MICPHCGTQMNDDAVFCISCGIRVAGVPAEPVMVSEPEKKEKNRAPLIIGSGVLAIMLIVGAVCLLLLNPFGSKKVSDTPLPTVPQEESSPGNTPSETAPDETIPDETIPIKIDQDGARIIGQAPANRVGVPVPEVAEEVLETAAEQFWNFLKENQNAEAYALLDIVGDDLQELIVKERKSDDSFNYSIYYLHADQVEQIDCGDLAAGGKEKLLSDGQSLIILYDGGYANTVTITPNLTSNVSFAAAEREPAYLASSALVSAHDRSLLSLHLLGDHKNFSYTGWIRYENTDYYYDSGKPVTRKWVEDAGVLYYLGDAGCVTEIANQEILATFMDAYFASYQNAFNEKDASLLKWSTDHNREELSRKFQAEENRFLTISKLVCETTVHKGDDKTGDIQADVHLEYLQSGEWADAKDQTVQKNYRITLIWENGQWLINHMGNR